MLFIVYQVNDMNHKVTKKPCHERCYVDGVSTGILGDTRILSCQAFGNQSICNECNHSWLKHMHETYIFGTKESFMVNESIKKMIETNESKKDKFVKIIAELDEMVCLLLIFFYLGIFLPHLLLRNFASLRFFILDFLNSICYEWHFEL